MDVLPLSIDCIEWALDDKGKEGIAKLLVVCEGASEGAGNAGNKRGRKHEKSAANLVERRTSSIWGGDSQATVLVVVFSSLDSRICAGLPSRAVAQGTEGVVV